MTKIFKSIISVFLAVFMAVSLIAIPASAVSISKSSITLTKGYQTTLSVSGTSKSVTWSTGDKSIATVTSKGKVVGKAPGSTYIYAKTGSNTLKCKVTVVPAKITSSTSNVTLSKKGSTKTVTVEIKGSHSGVTVGTTNKKVATASWVKPIKWDGDKISFTITAQGTGTAKIKVYLKNYSSTVYKYITVKVGNTAANEEVTGSNNSDSKITLVSQTSSVDVPIGGTITIPVYSSDHNNTLYAVSDTSVATVSAGSFTSYWRNFNVTGVKSGTTVLRLCNKNNTNNYLDIKINVSNNNYYELYTVMPTVKPLATDKIIKIPVNSSSTYYMIVPENYDPAYVNSLIGKNLKLYNYYEVYTDIPYGSKQGDTYSQFVHSNTKYNYGVRYVFLPSGYDKVALNTAIASYNEKFEYWTVYSAKPTVIDRADQTITWEINDASTGKTVTHYLLVPYYGYDQDRIDSIRSEDLAENSAYERYVGYSNLPSVNYTTDTVVTYIKNGQTKFMAVPKNDTVAGLVKANEAIYKDTGIFEYDVLYSTMPTKYVDTDVVGELRSGTTTYYVLLQKDATQQASVDFYKNYADGVR